MLSKASVLRGFSDKTTDGEKTGVLKRGPVNVVEEPETVESAAGLHTDIHRPLPAEVSKVASEQEILAKRKSRLQAGAAGGAMDPRKKQKVAAEASVDLVPSKEPTPVVAMAANTPILRETADVGVVKAVRIGGEEVPLKDEEIWPGVLSAAGGHRPVIPGLTAPEGPDNLCTLDVRAYDGWLGKGARPTDSFRAFTFPQDLVRMNKMTVREHSAQMVEALGTLNACALGLSSRLGVADHKFKEAATRAAGLEQRLRSNEAVVQNAQKVLEEAELRKKASDDKLIAVMMERDQAIEDATRFKMEISELRERLTESQAALKEAEATVKQLETNSKATEASYEAERLKTDERLKLLEGDLENKAAELTEMTKVAEQRKLSYAEHVKRFLKSRGFHNFFSIRAGPAFKMGFDALADLIKPGTVYDPKTHNLAACIDALGEEEEEAPASFPDDPEAEIPARELLSWIEPEEAGEASGQGEAEDLD